ncbi:copper amine oxidase [Saccharibacillus sp. O23]|uniref:phosphodiester glycosidase family protein n=1 Tax=Saccharibacillus sp. O23 TaxID=2009338 RepID=UPI000B4E6210|nr:phosphodiester glycosidase family protein [Saccharibacillus sp. O23]OWR33169.1 copper amine oxidase [Saccharibacillus sp. O23]
MKKGLKLLLAAALLAGAATSGIAPGTTGKAAAAASVKTFGYSNPAAGRTYVPIRVLSDFSGAKVNWNASSKRIDLVKGDKKIILHAGVKKAYIDGKAVKLDAAPFTDRNVTYVPLGLAAEQLGLNLKWDRSTSSMHIESGGKKMDLPVIKRGSLNSKPVRYKQQVFYMGNTALRANVITVQLMHPRVKLDAAFANHKAGSVQELRGIAAQNGAYAAINATYFDAYTSATYKAPYGYLVSNGLMRFVNGGTDRTVFAYDDNQLARLIPGLKFGAAYEAGQVEGAVQAGPLLLKNGQLAINARAEGFRDPHVISGRATRSAIGITANHELIMLTVRGATLTQLAGIMKRAGAYQAMNLDGGASSGLYINGHYVTKPGRKVSNALLVKLK